VLTFVGSIVWIAVYSYLMVWWATVTGTTIGIPSQVGHAPVKRFAYKMGRSTFRNL
jgi:hypothetical protein